MSERAIVGGYSAPEGPKPALPTTGSGVERDRDETLVRIAALESTVGLLMALCRMHESRIAEIEGAPALDDASAYTTLKGAAFLIDRSETTVRKRIASGRIQARRIGGRVLVKTASLTARKPG